MFKKTAIVTAITLLSGCASMFQGSTQNFQVSTANDKNPENTRCSIVNEEGAWQTVPNSMVVFTAMGTICKSSVITQRKAAQIQRTRILAADILYSIWLVRA
jgi:hypothetical protein